VGQALQRDKLEDGRLTKDEKDFQYWSICFAGEEQVLRTQKGYKLGYSKSFVTPLAASVAAFSLVEKLLSGEGPESTAAEVKNRQVTANDIGNYAQEAVESLYQAGEQANDENAEECCTKSMALMGAVADGITKRDFRFHEYWSAVYAIATSRGSDISGEALAKIKQAAYVKSQQLQELAETKGKDYARNALYSNLMLALKLNQGLFGDLLTT
jgi:hypothetical protein